MPVLLFNCVNGAAGAPAASAGVPTWTEFAATASPVVQSFVTSWNVVEVVGVPHVGADVARRGDRVAARGDPDAERQGEARTALRACEGELTGQV